MRFPAGKILFSFFFLILIGLLLSSSAALKKDKTIYVLSGRECPGLFSEFISVLGLLDYYKKGKCTGLEVNFEDRGAYYDPEIGLNWWNYYFEPIVIGYDPKADKKTVSPKKRKKFVLNVTKDMSRDKAYDFINKYIHLKPFLQTKIDDFIERNFKNNFILGIHYRGTDKYTEAPPVTYEQVAEAIQNTFLTLQINKNYKILVATDEEDFLEFMIKKYPNRVIYSNTIRSTSTIAVHKDQGNNFKKGEEAIIDCLLLSRCNFLIRTSSNLSLCSTYFNPKLPFILLNPGKFDKPPKKKK